MQGLVALSTRSQLQQDPNLTTRYNQLTEAMPFRPASQLSDATMLSRSQACEEPGADACAVCGSYDGPAGSQNLNLAKRIEVQQKRG